MFLYALKCSALWNKSNRLKSKTSEILNYCSFYSTQWNSIYENIKEYGLKFLKINKILNILLFIDFEFLKNINIIFFFRFWK